MSRRTGVSVVFDTVEQAAALLTFVCSVVMGGVNGLVMPVARGLSFGRNRLVPFWFNLLWAGGNILTFVFVYWGCAVFEGQTMARLCLAVAAFMTFIHVVILIGRILVVLEDNRVMNGLLREKYRRFCGHVIHNSLFALGVSIVAYILFGIELLWLADCLAPGVLGEAMEPGEIVGFADWAVLFLFKGVPLADRLLELAGVHPVLSFSNGFGRLVAVLIYVVNGVLLYYAIVLYARQWYHLYALFAALSSECVGDECRADIPLLQQRATRAPANTKRRILSIAVSHPVSIVRRRAISIARHARIVTFAQTFVHNLHKESEDSNKLWGIRVADLLLEDETLAAFYTTQHMDILIDKINHQLRRNRGRKHSDRVKERLVRLQNSARSLRNSI